MAATTDPAINEFCIYEATENGERVVMFCTKPRDQNRHTAASKRKLVAFIVGLCILPELGMASAQVGPNSAANPSEPSSSIWADTAFDARRADGLDGLNTSESETDGRQDPILVPLPAPILAAVSGLGLAWILRKRMTRV